MKAVVVARGDLDSTDLRELADADLVVAADGGAAGLRAADARVDLLIGDLDSADAALVDELAAAGTRVERHPSDKDASDTELAVRAAVAAGATEVVLLGAVGGDRLDHELANLLLLADPALAGIGLRVVHGGTTVRAVRDGGTLDLGGRVGDAVTLLPIGGDAAGVATEGLRWPLRGETLRMGGTRGLSNEVVAADASVRIGNGTLLVVESVTREDRPT